uniref:Arginine/serine-rich coiled-coil protein 2 isoform X1 n=1 Tax=Rhizophora mucronata TaxID=61149 RepID=A0A2P2KM65_RHIMU
MVEGIQKDLKRTFKDLIQQCVHLVVEVLQCTASLDPSEVPSASRLEQDRLLCDPHSHCPSHPTIGHRYQGNLRL